MFGHSTMPSHIAERYREASNMQNWPANLKPDHIKQLRQLVELCARVDEEFQFVLDALDSFNAMYRVSRSSNLCIVGYFSVIEALITHQPRLSETLDSISHQIRGKLVLLNKRFDRPVDPECFFDDASEIMSAWMFHSPAKPAFRCRLGT